MICAHFGTCGGCAYQNLTPDEYRALKRDEIVHALAQHGFDNAVVNEIVSVPPQTRRRASLKVEKKNGAVLIGFHAAKSHDIVDMRECLVLSPEIFSALPVLRDLFGAILKENEKAELHITETETGLDLSLHWNREASPKLIAELAPWAAKLKLARITNGDEILVELAQPQIRFGTACVDLPPDSFLQPTQDGEEILLAHIIAALGKAKHIADLFAGLGTFSLPLAERAKVHAVEFEKSALETLAKAARNTPGLKPITTESRNLEKLPLTPAELNRFDAVLLDPPRGGAAAQARALAQSKVPRIIYVSCNAASFARDARILADGGYTLGPIHPVDQFLWSSHTELVSAFVREK